MQTIKMNCDCGKVHEVRRDNEAPKNAISMGCNWCPDCEDTADDYYNEWYNNNDDGDDNQNTEPDVPDNQLMLFSIADDILQNHVVKRDVARFSSFGIDKFPLKKLITNLSLREKNLFFRVIITYNSIYKKIDVRLIEDLENYDYLKISSDKKEVIGIILKCQKDIIFLQLTSLQIIQLKKNKNDIRLHQSKYRQTNGRESTV